MLRKLLRPPHANNPAFFYETVALPLPRNYPNDTQGTLLQSRLGHSKPFWDRGSIHLFGGGLVYSGVIA